MTLRTLFITAAVSLVALQALPAAAQMKVGSDRHTQALPLTPDGTVRVDNVRGNLIIVGTDGATVSITVDRIVRGVDDEAVTEGRRSTKLSVRSDGRNMILQSLIGFHNVSRWTAVMNYTLRVPRSANVQLNSGIAERIHIQDLHGALLVKNNGGEIAVINSPGPMNVETSNGNLRVLWAEKPTHNARLVSVNGRLEVTVPEESRFEWLAETLRGNLFSSLEMRGAFDAARSGKYFRAIINGGNGPRIETFTISGPIFLLTKGVRPQQASILQPDETLRPIAADPVLVRNVNTGLLRPTSARTFVFQKSLLAGNVSFDTSMGNIFVGEVRGNADLRTRGGEIVVGYAGGAANVRTNGGPINLGESVGRVDANTEAGDVSVRVMRKGGKVVTGGGDILIGLAGGDVDLTSGGGDLTISRAAGSVIGQTRSGNVQVAIDSNVKSQRVDLKTTQGNILLSVPAGFGADIDATIFTLDPTAHTIKSDIPGLTITTDRSTRGMTRIRATGKINGGGQKVELRTEEGDIQIRARSTVPRK